MSRMQIVPPGTAVTNNVLAAELRAAAPRSVLKAQDVLVAAKKYANGGGWFSSEKSRLQRMQQEVYALGRLLEQEGYGGGVPTRMARVFAFLNQFSQAFPNWQREYEVLNKFAPMFY